MPALLTRTGRYAVLSAEILGRGLTPLGVLLQDPESDVLYQRIRADLPRIADPEEREVLEPLADDLAAKAREMGAERLFAWLEENASGTLTVTDRQSVLVDDFTRALNRLYRGRVQSEVRPFETHLPRYSLRVAAGKFLENEEIAEQSWEEAPPGLRLASDMFVAEIVGHSMEPAIPDGSLCVFRAGVAGSRNGRLVLVENLETTGNNRYTVKRYRSEKTAASRHETTASRDETDVEWRHARIRLESLNPEYPSWDLAPDQDKYRIIAEFVRVLD